MHAFRCLFHTQDTGCHLYRWGNLCPPETLSTSCSWNSRCATGVPQRRCTCFLQVLRAMTNMLWGLETSRCSCVPEKFMESRKIWALWNRVEQNSEFKKCLQFSFFRIWIGHVPQDVELEEQSEEFMVSFATLGNILVQLIYWIYWENVLKWSVI